jgi:glycosyltransferase involved in cell wall biosynthesis
MPIRCYGPGVDSRAAAVPAEPVSPFDLASRATGLVAMTTTVRRLRYGVVGSWQTETTAPARFATALDDSLGAGNEIARIACSTPAPADAHPSGSMASPRPLDAVANELNRCDVAIVHHGVDELLSVDGASVLSSRLIEVIDLLQVPTIIVLHHVPGEPTDDQRSMLGRACRSADAVVVTTAPAAVRLAGVYDVDPSAVWLIRSDARQQRIASPESGRAVVVSWGVLAPGSGIEWMIDAMEQLSALDVRYLVAGPATDDMARDGAESYRDMLVRRCWSRRVPAYVSLGHDDADQTAMGETLRRAVAVVMPQDIAGSHHIEGLLEELVASEVPIVATDDAAMSAGLPSDAVMIVPPRDPGALADAVLRLMIDPHLAESIVRRAACLWPAIPPAGMASRFTRVTHAAIRSSLKSAVEAATAVSNNTGPVPVHH